MKKIDYWAMQYHQNPYLSALSDEQLGIRHKAVMANGISITSDNKYGVNLNPPWNKRHVELQSECARRQIDLKMLFSAGERFKDHIPTLPDAKQFAIWTKRYRNLLNKGYLFRFLELDHAREILEGNTIHFGKATTYTNPTLTAAQMDDECSLTVWNKKGSYWHTLRSAKEFYISSYSWTFDPRFISAFKKTRPLACIVLKRPDLFIKRIKTSLIDLNSRLRLINGTIRYIDPLKPGGIRAKDIPFTKDFLYTYQSEYRFALFSGERLDSDSLKLKCTVRDLFELVEFE